MTSVARGIESKFEAPDGARVPEFAGLPGVASVGGPQPLELEATYFDTDDLVLAAAGITLRRRTGGNDAGWHLKIPAPDVGRDELRLPLGRATKSVPKPLREAVWLYTRGQRLVQVAQVRTHRREYHLCDSEQRTLAAVSDDNVTAHTPAPADTGLMTAWREWEVELVDGRRQLLAAAATLLREAGAAPAAHESKLLRVLGDRVPRADASAPDGAPPRRSGPAAAPVAARLREQVAVLEYQDPRVRRDVPDAVHQMRVAMRRLRSALATFRPLLDRGRTEPVREELKWIAAVLGEARDAEVMHQRLAAVIAAEPVELVIGPVARRVDRELGDAYREAHARSVDAMQSERYLRLVDRLDALVADPPWTPLAREPADRVLRARVNNDYKRLRRRVRSVEYAPDRATRDARLHDVRKAAKRARYAAETLAPVYGQQADRFAKATKRVQSTLGEHHDAVVTQAWLRQLGVQAHLDGDNAFTYGRLHDREQCRAMLLEAKFEKVWAKTSRKKLRRWLT